MLLESWRRTLSLLMPNLHELIPPKSVLCRESLLNAPWHLTNWGSRRQWIFLKRKTFYPKHLPALALVLNRGVQIDSLETGLNMMMEMMMLLMIMIQWWWWWWWGMRRNEDDDGDDGGEDDDDDDDVWKQWVHCSGCQWLHVRLILALSPLPPTQSCFFLF